MYQMFLFHSVIKFDGDTRSNLIECSDTSVFSMAKDQLICSMMHAVIYLMVLTDTTDDY